jgi:VWFA-related protein
VSSTVWIPIRAWLAGYVVLGLIGFAQEPFRGGVDLVRLDVAVLNGEGRPVPDLSVNDFSLVIDGTPRHIDTFARIDIPESVETAARPVWAVDVPSDVATNDYDNRRLFVMVMDDAMIINDVGSARGAIEIANGILGRLGPNDLMAVVFTRDNRGAQDFTADKAKLRAAIQHFQPGTAYMDSSSYSAARGTRAPDINSDSYAYASSLHTLEEVAEALIAIPDRRKALVYIGEGVPVDPELATLPAMGHSAENSAIQRDLMGRMQELFRAAQRANVAIYGFDPSPVGFENSLTSFLMQHGVVARAAMDRAHDIGSLTTDFMESAASNTGGRAALTVGGAPAAIDRMFRETGSYYLLGFRKGEGKPDVDHRVEVSINRPGSYDIRARNHYRDETPGEIRENRADPNSTAIAGLIPSAGIGLELAAIPFADPNGKTSLVALVIDVRVPQPATRTEETLELTMRAFTPEGVLRATHQQTVRATVRAGSAGAIARLRVLSSIAVATGRYELRVGVRNVESQESGSVYADVDVPDFAKTTLSMSGIAIRIDGATAGAMAVPTALAAVLPASTTTGRVFTASDKVAVRACLYTTAKAPTAMTVTESVLNASGEVVSEQVQVVNAERFIGAPRAAVVDDPLALQGLPSGSYLLVLRAAAIGGTPIERRVPFRIE